MYKSDYAYNIMQGKHTIKSRKLSNNKYDECCKLMICFYV